MESKITIDYSSTVLLVIKPPSRVVSSHRVKDKSEHQKILKLAFEKQHLVYSASVEHRDGKYYAIQPWVVDWDSVNALYETNGSSKVKEDSKPAKNVLFCPYCDHKINSKPGRTLHVKSKHQEKLEEYRTWLKSHGKD